MIAGKINLGSTHPHPSLLCVKAEEAPSYKNELKQAAQDMESLFLLQMIKEMRNSLNEDWDIMGGGFGSKMTRDVLDGEMANHMAKSQGIGLADIIFNQMAPQHNNQIQKTGRSD